MLDLQKATFSKRISAYLFDIILLFIAIVGIGCIISAVVGYDGELNTLENMYQEYADKYGIDMEKYETLSGKYGKYATDKGEEGIVLEITESELSNMTATEKAEFEEFEALFELVKKANAEIEVDGEVAGQYSKIITLTLLIITLGTFLSYLVLEFAVPLFIGNGQTLGKKIFGVALMRADGVKITTMQLFVRTILGKYTLETMIPIAIVAMMFVGAIGIIGPIVLLGIIILEVVCYVRSNTGSFIHDMVAVTVCVDYSSQMIFETEEELIEYKKQISEQAINEARHTAEPLSSIYSRKKEATEPASDGVAPEQSYSSVSMGAETTVNDVMASELSENGDLPNAELVSDEDTQMGEGEPENTDFEATDVAKLEENPSNSDAEREKNESEPLE